RVSTAWPGLRKDRPADHHGGGHREVPGVPDAVDVVLGGVDEIDLRRVVRPASTGFLGIDVLDVHDRAEVDAALRAIDLCLRARIVDGAAARIGAQLLEARRAHLTASTTFAPASTTPTR